MCSSDLVISTCWPASPLYTLSIAEPELARKVAGDSVLRVKLAVKKGEDHPTPEYFDIASAVLDNGTKVPSHHLRLRLNTLGESHYWIDSGSVFVS